MTQIEKAGQKIAEELRKLDKLSRNIEKEDTAEERRAAQKAAWNIQEEKRKTAWARQQEITKRSLEVLKEKVKQNKKSPEQMISEGAFAEDERLRKMGITPRYF
jgi:hypothetical protein